MRIYQGGVDSAAIFTWGVGHMGLNLIVVAGCIDFGTTGLDSGLAHQVGWNWCDLTCG